MSLSIIFSRARVGITSPLVTIEVHLSNGLPSFAIVGLPETTVRESKDRVRSAIINSGLEFPNRKITINLAPADLPKEGGRFDLAIALGILAASKQIPDKKLHQYEFYGELGLNGDIRSIVGEIPSALACAKANRICVLPPENANNASIIENSELRSANHLIKVIDHFKSDIELPAPEDLIHVDASNVQSQADKDFSITEIPSFDLSDVIGQPMAKRALELAASGQHNLLFLGPPGTGKSMLAQRLAGLLPPLTDEQALESAAVRSISGVPFDYKHWRIRPFRAPHHTTSATALTGGGSIPKPGEISLAHHGVLFLDELPEFSRYTLDALREPLESGLINISRARHQVQFPAQFQLIAALNPSPTGHHSDGRATADQILKYLNKISGPFLDRIDIQIEVPALPKGALTDNKNAEQRTTTMEVASRVAKARAIMLNRAGKPNALLTSKEVDRDCSLSRADHRFLEETIFKLNMSIRAYHKILKVARTIADLEQATSITRAHLSEALSYRAMDRLLKHLSF